ncbi:hypothetical protein GCM10028827_22230 [Mucilaginibacter myungsuensis]
MLTTSCSKSSIILTPANNSNINAAMAKQLALDIYRSMSGNFKSSSAEGLKTNAANGCGSVVTTPSNSTTTSGDTTRVFTGNRVFTYMCNGFYNNGKTLDAYLLKDQYATEETGNGFKNIYRTNLDYTVKAKTWDYTHVDVTGNTSIDNYTSKLSGGNVTEWHTLKTDYVWESVIAQRDVLTNASRFVFGLVTFNTTIVNNVAGTAQQTYQLKGKIVFRDDNKMTTMFISDNGQYKTYLTDLTTGQVTEI